MDKWILLKVFIFLEVLIIATLKDNPINEQIRCKEMMVIGPNGEQLGIKSRQDALTLANYAGFDLVLMSENANPAVCKIMDYNKFRYREQLPFRYRAIHRPDLILQFLMCWKFL